MPTYNYRCTKECTIEDLKKAKETVSKPLMAAKSGELVWEETHPMSKNPKIKCPLCNAKAVKTFLCTTMPEHYIRGNGYLDKAGCRRDMDLFKLQKGEDPYGHMRQPGEVDHIKDTLKRGGKHNPKTKYFT
jgi:predicted nucleic acid-binding Zn ribbon protein